MKIDELFAEDYIENILIKYSHDFTKFYYIIPFSELFQEISDKFISVRILGLIKIEIGIYFKYINRSKVMLKLDYENQSILVMEFRENMYKFNFVFPYERYDEMYKIIYKINNLVSSDGMVLVYANNVPWELKSGLLINTSSNSESIKDLAITNGMNIDTSFGLDEFLKELGGRKYNATTLPPGTSVNEIEMYLSSLFIHSSKATLEKQKYIFSDYKKTKLFVSYSQKDKTTVYDTIQKLEDRGLNFWVDYKEIDYGNSIIEKVDLGIKECDLPIIFLSENTKTSLFAKYELKTFLRKIIYEQSSSKPWLIIKLDDIDLDDLFTGLSDYKYFDYQVQGIEELTEIIQKKIGK